MKDLINRLKNELLPECFRIDSTVVEFDDPAEFMRVIGDPVLFASEVGRNTSAEAGKAWVDTYESGFLASIALSLWFMEFDEDNWFSFDDIHDLLWEFFSARSRLKERIELRLVRGSYPPMMLNQPVLIDMKERRICFLFGELND